MRRASGPQWPRVRDNPIQFAVVREDPLVEVEVLRRHPCRSALLIASGGCTALTLQAVFPELALTLLDPNVAQLDLVQRKVDALEKLSGAARKERFNVETDDPTGLSECGNFESLFRGLRTFLHEFVLPRDDVRRLFEEPGALAEAPRLLFEHRFWPVAFGMYFSDPLLNAIFGDAATQHAEPGSYPDYFRRLSEAGLARGDARDNPFLHHVFLGHYLDREGCLPRFLTAPAAAYRFAFAEGALDAGVDLSAFDLVDLSNIMDWMSPADVASLLTKVRDEMRPGAAVLWRQLNNRRNLEGPLREHFAFDAAWQRSLQERDRSPFYSSVHVGVRGPR